MGATPSKKQALITSLLPHSDKIPESSTMVGCPITAVVINHLTNLPPVIYMFKPRNKLLSVCGSFLALCVNGLFCIITGLLPET